MHYGGMCVNTNVLTGAGRSSSCEGEFGCQPPQSQVLFPQPKHPGQDNAEHSEPRFWGWCVLGVVSKG